MENTNLKNSISAQDVSIVAPDRKANINIILALVVCSFMAVYYNGTRALYLILASVISCIVLEFVVRRLFGVKRQSGDWSMVITGLMIPLLMPVTVPLYVIFIAQIIAIVVAKFPFGGYGNNIFNPTAVAVAFACLSWPQYMFAYPQPFADLSSPATSIGISPASTLLAGGVPHIAFMDALTGNFAGPMGTTAILVICACAVYLIASKTISWVTSFFGLATVTVISAIFPRLQGGVLSSVAYELICETLLFGFIFMANDPITSPKTNWGRAYYGVLLGLLIMFCRHFGNIELSFVFSLILANSLSTVCDVLGKKTKQYVKPKYKELSKKFSKFVTGKLHDKFDLVSEKAVNGKSAKRGKKDA